MNQIVIAIKGENILTYLTLFDNKPERLLSLAKRDCMTKNFETQVIQRRQIQFRKKNLRCTLCNYNSETFKY